jgi:probable F420-dependent oxidoreductase
MRWGITVPFAGIPLADHEAVYATIAAAGYTDVWSSEVAGADGFTPLALAAAWQPGLRLGTAIAPVFTRGPALLAMTAAALAEAAPGRFALGIGASSPVIVEDWNAVSYVDPLGRTRDVLRFLKPALAGELADGDFGSFAVRRFRLERPPAVPPPILLAALRPGMLRLAAAEADGVILNWLSAGDVATALGVTGRRAGFEVAARIFVCPTADAATAREIGRRLVAAYLTVPAYAEFQRWLGRAKLLAPLWEAWAAGDRRSAAASVPDEVVDALVLHGSPAECRAQVAAYVQAGVGTPVIALVPTPELAAGGAAALGEVVAALAPSTVED